MTDPQFIAKQLRKPSGNFAPEIAAKMGKGNRPLYDLMISFLEVHHHDSILEIGYGSGTHFSNLFAKANNLQVNGIDYSPEMTNLAKLNNSSFVENEKLNLQTGNSELIPFTDNSFDIVFCNMVIYFWDDPAVHLSEIRRVLKTGGKFYTGMRTRNSMLGFPFTKFGFNLYRVEEWCSKLESNGFKVVEEIRQMDPVFDFDDAGNSLKLESVCIEAKA